MITRSLRLRHGRIAIAKPSQPIRPWRRSLAISARRTAQEQQPAEYDKISADWEFFQHQRKLTGKVGASVSPHYKPNDLLRDPPRPQDITLEMLLAAQTHLGHRTSLWHPANSRYIHGVWGQTHDAIHVISLDVTAAHLRRACKVVEGVAARGGLVLFVGTRDGQAAPVTRAAKMAGGYHLFDKWTPGTLTNAEQILGKCRKKIVNELDEELLGFENQLSLRAAIKPDLVVCLNPLENYVLLHECGLHAIPTIGIVDTDVNPTWVTYPIPANDDSLRSVSTIAGALGRAGEAGRLTRRARAKKGLIDFVPASGLTVPTFEEVQAAKRRREQSSNKDFDEDDEVVLTEAEAAIFEEPRQATPSQETMHILEQPDATRQATRIAIEPPAIRKATPSQSTTNAIRQPSVLRQAEEQIPRNEFVDDMERLTSVAEVIADEVSSPEGEPQELTQDEEVLLNQARTNEMKTTFDEGTIVASESSASAPEPALRVEAANEDAKIAFAQATSAVPVEKAEEAAVRFEAFSADRTAMFLPRSKATPEESLNSRSDESVDETAIEFAAMMEQDIDDAPTATEAEERKIAETTEEKKDS